MDNNVKGLHNCSRVPLCYDLFFDARGDLFNKLPNTIAMMPEVTEMVASPTIVSHMPNGSPLNLGHLCDSHVRYNLSHSTSSPSVVAGH